MSLKQEIETWVKALAHYDNNEFEDALKVFDNIAETSKIFFNCGVIHATIGEHERAVECYQRAIQLDQYLAVAYFQQGVSNFLVGDFEEALANFNDTLLYLRGNTYIDYEQLGLKFRLYSCEVLFNRGLCYVYLQQDAAGMQDFAYAVKEKMTPDHEVINEAIRDRAVGYNVFSIPVGVVYRPNEAKVKNLKTKDYLGKARLVAASAGANTSVGFQGSDRKEALAAEQAAKDDRPAENISFAATNLVQKNLSGRGGGREQSAPPTLSRNMFPPTPPPETDKPPRSSAPTIPGRSASVRSPPPKPLGQQRQNDEIQRNDPRLDRPGMFGRSNTVDIYRTASPSHAANADRSDFWTPPQLQRTKTGPTRTSSEPRLPTGQRRQYERRPALFRETTPQRPFEPIQEDNGFEDVYDMYQTRSSGGSGRSGSRQRAFNGEPRFSNSSNDTAMDVYEEDEFAEVEPPYFDMAGGAPNSRARQANLPMRSSSRRRPDIRNVRIKVHAHEDTRYMMFGSTIDYGDFERKIREKFAFKSKLRIRMQDEGDMITMGDQDDLDMLLSAAKEAARIEHSEMAKMEVWVQEV